MQRSELFYPNYKTMGNPNQPTTDQPSLQFRETPNDDPALCNKGYQKSIGTEKDIKILFILRNDINSQYIYIHSEISLSVKQI